MSGTQFIYCEGCGARLDPQERSCPKCGRPAPGILSADSSAHDLAAGKTASFPKLSQEMIENAIPTPSPIASIPVESSFDEQATGVLDRSALDRAATSGRRKPSVGAFPTPASDADAVDYLKRKRAVRRVVATGMAALILMCGFLFVLIDPLQVMPGIYDSFEQAASDAFPSRQKAEDESARKDSVAEDPDAPATPDLTDATLSEEAAFARLTELYQKIRGFEDDLGPVIDSYNGYYIAFDISKRKEEAQKSYDLRDGITQVKQELSDLNLAQDSAYKEDVEHLQQLATWMYNRVDVLCRSWDISLAVPEGEYPSETQDEILAPLRQVEKVDGKAVDVIEYERNVLNWEPREK